MGLRASRDREPQRRLHSIPGLGFRVEGLGVEGSQASVRDVVLAISPQVTPQSFFERARAERE